MRKVAVIAFLVFICFGIEMFLFDFFGRWFMPNLLLLLVIFFDLSLGIRYGIVTAILAGLIKDTFSSGTFGINTFGFILVAYLTILLKRNFYRTGSNSSRLFLVFIVCLANLIIISFMKLMMETIRWSEMAQFILIPQTISTLLLTTFVFHHLRRCVQRLFTS